MLVKLSVSTSQHTQMVDITHLVQKAVADSGIREGICTVFIPHTTAAVTINENADPDVVRDFTTEIDKIVAGKVAEVDRVSSAKEAEIMKV